LFWGDRCVDFDVKKQTWLHNRAMNEGADEPTVLQLKDESVHYLWRMDKSAEPTPATGVYYQAEADGKTVKVANARQYRAAAVGDRIVVCYTLDDQPDKALFRVINHGALGPVKEITVAKGRKHNLWSDYMLLHAETDRIWFVNTIASNTVYELKLADAKK